MKQQSQTMPKSYEEGISDLAYSLEQKMTTVGSETAAIIDFTNSGGDVTDLGLVMTEDIAAALADSERAFWIVSGPYLLQLITRSEFNINDIRETPEVAARLWQTMGIEAVITGTVTRQDENLLQLSTNMFTMNFEEDGATSEQMFEEYAETMRAKKIKEVGRQPVLRGASREAAQIPEFPWPPPQPSASAKIPSEFLLNSEEPTSLHEVAERLERAFEQAGYGEYSYYRTPDGFALVSQIEQFHPDGASKEAPDRWAATLTPPRSFSLSAYMKSLFSSQAGYYRIITFLVTSAPFSQTSATVTPEEAEAWLSDGVKQLPASIGELRFTDQHYCLALIYEFEQADQNKPPTFNEVSALTGKEHLKKATLWSVLFSLRAILQF